MFSFEAIYFDMDGTLVYSPQHHLHYEAWVQVFQKMGISFSQDEFQKDFFGRANPQLYALLETEYQVDGLSTCLEKERVYRDILVPKFLQPVPGLFNLLNLLKEKSITVGVITSAPLLNWQSSAHALGLDQYFEPRLVLTEEEFKETQNFKPSPKPFIEMARRTQIPISKSIFVGDSEADMLGAKNAGMFRVGIETHLSPDEFKKLDANISLPDYTHFDLDLIEKEFQKLNR